MAAGMNPPLGSGISVSACAALRTTGRGQNESPAGYGPRDKSICRFPGIQGKPVWGCQLFLTQTATKTRQKPRGPTHTHADCFRLFESRFRMDIKRGMDHATKIVQKDRRLWLSKEQGIPKADFFQKRQSKPLAVDPR